MELMNEFQKGEEGIDYIPEWWKNDPRFADLKRVKSDLRHKINEMKFENPEAAKLYAEHFLKRNQWDDLVEGKFDNDYDFDKIVKYYPGSPKGPDPKDDPDFYSQWFMRNYPDELKNSGDDANNFHHLGVRYKYVWNKQNNDDKGLNMEYKDLIDNKLMQEELFDMQHYDGVPEFDMTDHFKYDHSLPGKMPALRFHTQIDQDELLPMPEDHTLRYSELHYEIERWSLFKTLPMIMEFDQDVRSMINKMASGTVPIPDFVKEVNPPSLWAYYYTLPKWAREDPIVKNVMMAMEYHQPGVNIRTKEAMLNYACSFLRPIGDDMKEIIVQMATSNKIQLNVQIGNKMINELPFWQVDHEEIGDSSDDDSGKPDGSSGDIHSAIAKQVE